MAIQKNPPPSEGGSPPRVTDTAGPSSGISRRAVTTAAAWSVPVVLAVAAAPLAAASHHETGGIITFDYPEYIAGPSMVYANITGKVTPTVGTPMPATVTLTYPSGWSGPTTASVNPDGTFTVTGVVAPPTVGSGTLTASAPNFTPGNTTLTVLQNPVPPAVDGVVWGDNDFDILYYFTGVSFQTRAVTPDSINGAGTLAPTSIIAMAGGYRG